MSVIDFAKRLRRMVHEECKVKHLEYQVARKSAKIYVTLNELQSQVLQQQTKLFKQKNKLVKNLEENQMFESSVLEEISRLNAAKRAMEHYESEYNQECQEKITQRQQKLSEMENLRKLKETIGIRINVDGSDNTVPVLHFKKDDYTEWHIIDTPIE